MQTFLNVEINNSIGNKEEEEEEKTIKPERCNKSDRLDFSEIAFYSDHDFCCNHWHLQIDLKIVRQSCYNGQVRAIDYLSFEISSKFTANLCASPSEWVHCTGVFRCCRFQKNRLIFHTVNERFDYICLIFDSYAFGIV